MAGDVLQRIRVKVAAGEMFERNDIILANPDAAA